MRVRVWGSPFEGDARSSSRAPTPDVPWRDGALHVRQRHVTFLLPCSHPQHCLGPLQGLGDRWPQSLGASSLPCPAA